VLNAAIAALNKWVVRGTSPPVAPLLQVVDGTPPVISRDAHGNALGGIRTPAVDVPIAVLSGIGQTGSAFCSLFGTTVLFDDATVAALYPKHSAYVSAVSKAANAAAKAGFLVKADAKLIKAAAKASDVGN